MSSRRLARKVLTVTVLTALAAFGVACGGDSSGGGGGGGSNGGDINVTQHWGVSAYGNRDLIQNAWVIRDLGVFYKDECIRVDVFYRHEDVIIGRLGSSDQLSVRLTLATLGGPIYGR